MAQTPAPKPDEQTQTPPEQRPQTQVTKLETSNEGSENETVGCPQRNRQQPEQLLHTQPTNLAIVCAATHILNGMCSMLSNFIVICMVLYYSMPVLSGLVQASLLLLYTIRNYGHH